MMSVTNVTSLSTRLGTFWKSWRTLSERRVVSKPQTNSRLRYVKIVTNQNETPQELEYRRQYNSLQDWNNQYWAKNNELFEDEKSSYIRLNFPELNNTEVLSHDQLGPFYRKFLDDNRLKHVDYNRLWYENYLTLLSYAFGAKMSRLKVNLLSSEK